ncbi:hypothetical protein BC629DRAFT_1490575 [Irpex lacteus]|nr:hypothetical protein BC629DRAFT_1490575 [Irpex lacteus]
MLVWTLVLASSSDSDTTPSSSTSIPPPLSSTFWTSTSSLSPARSPSTRQDLPLSSSARMNRGFRLSSTRFFPLLPRPVSSATTWKLKRTRMRSCFLKRRRSPGGRSNSYRPSWFGWSYALLSFSSWVLCLLWALVLTSSASDTTSSSSSSTPLLDIDLDLVSFSCAKPFDAPDSPAELFCEEELRFSTFVNSMLPASASSCIFGDKMETQEDEDAIMLPQAKTVAWWTV